MLASIIHQYQNKHVALIGFGVTGKACAEFLLVRGASVSVFDKAIQKSSIGQPDLSSFFQQAMSNNQLCFYPLDKHTQLHEFDCVIVSPGVNLNQDFIQHYLSTGKKVMGDIELFAQENQVPVIAVTGSNGKSTVVDMLTQVLQAAGYKVGLGGNFGTSALDLLNQDFDYIVLELSSFQLESTYSLSPFISCILNVTPDHMDRHGTMEAYTKAKQRIYHHAEYIIFNRDDALSYPLIKDQQALVNNVISIGLTKPELTSTQATKAHYYQTQDGIFLLDNMLLSAQALHCANQYQLLNMQVVLACANVLHINTVTTSSTLQQYKGLAHRFELVHQTEQCVWINDSKATNPGASIAAIEALAKQNTSIVLIAGGDGKGADMSALKTLIKQSVSYLVLIGKDADKFTDIGVQYSLALDLPEAVAIANAEAKALQDKHDKRIAVLLSPACASIDMFQNYQQRGEIFVQNVHEWVAA